MHSLFVAALASLTPAATPVPAGHGTQVIAAQSGRVEPRRVCVKFDNGSPVRTERGTLTWSKGAVPALPPGTWSRSHTVTDAELERQRAAAIANTKADLPDLRLEFHLVLPAGADLAATLDQLAALDIVDYALPVPLPTPTPLPPNYQSSQRYINPAVEGIGTQSVWTWPGGTGTGVNVCDVEYSFNAAHSDLPAVTVLGATPTNPFADNHHGTATIGQVSARNNGWGTTGAAHGVTMFFAGTYFNNTTLNVAAGVTAAASGLQPGDVILIEQQMFGPVSSQYVPVEWYLPTYNAIRQAVLSGIVVVEAAGNGSQNLDLPIYSTGNGNHWPFLAQNDSGAIIVGAGAASAAAGGTTTARSRLSFSNYGQTVDLQGWGERVTTTGYGALYSAEGLNLYYTSTFSGTSSASPIVTSACAVLQGVHQSITGSPLTPAQTRTLLRSTGSAQTSGINPSTQNIGPLPNVPAAIALAFGNQDCNSNTRPDRVDIAMGLSADTNTDLIPDECQVFCDPIDFNQDGLFPDTADIDDYLAVFSGGACPTTACNDIDFNNDGLFPDTADIDALLSVFSGGPCP